MNSFRKRNFNAILQKQSFGSIKAKHNEDYQHTCIGLLNIPRNLQLKSSNIDYTDKCHLFWNIFDKPAKPLLFKLSFASARATKLIPKRITKSIPAIH